MVRKSERNKAQGTPEKLIPERTRKSTRQSSRRKKKSSSESEGEPDVLVDKDIKEVGELSESKSQSEPEGPEAKQDGARLRRSVRRHPDASQSDKEQEHEKNSEWKEDPSFWHPEGPAPKDTGGEPKALLEDGTTWKVQSSNGSGGEIQKLKICRQRVTDSNDSASPTKEASPRRVRKSTRSSKNLEVSKENIESKDEVTEEKISVDTVTSILENNEISGLENNEAVSQDCNQEKLPESESYASKDIVPDPGLGRESGSTNIPLLNDSMLPDTLNEIIADDVMTNSSVKGSEENEIQVTGLGNESCDFTAMNSSRKSSEEGEGTVGAENSEAAVVDTESSEAAAVDIESSEAAAVDTERSEVAAVDTESSEAAAVDTESSEVAAVDTESSAAAVVNTESSEAIAVDTESSVLTPFVKTSEEAVVDVESSIGEDTTQDKPAEFKDVVEAIIDKDNSSMNIEESDGKSGAEIVEEEEVSQKSPEIPGDEISDEKVTDVSVEKVPENHEEILSDNDKKLTETTTEISKEFNSERLETNKKEESFSSEPNKSPREEGELSPVLETKKSNHTTIVIRRPKEVSSEPTKLKRNTDDLPPTERKRRLVSTPKPKESEEDPFNISSQSLMLLVPEVKTITPEQVASFPLDDEDLFKFEMNQPCEISSKKKGKPKEVEPKEIKQASKKKIIVINNTEGGDDVSSVGPKLPHHENHKVIRKISLTKEEVKKERRSLSPSGNAPTEVLFITNLVRPFTIPQLRELLARTGTIASNGFYIDKIKSKCYVKYTDVEMAVETRHALNGVRWPVNNPKTLKVEFATADDMSVVQKMAEEETAAKKQEAVEPPAAAAGWLSEQAASKPQRRVTTAVREWDMGKAGIGATEEKKPVVEEWNTRPEPLETKRRAVSPVEVKLEAPARKMKKRDQDAPARLLDDLFRKTKATPCIYWLPLTAAQIAVKEEMRRQHMAEHERRLAELRKSDQIRREKDREKSRESRRKK